MRSLVQVSCSLKSSIGGPVQVVKNVSPLLKEHFRLQLIVFGHHEDPNLNALHEATFLRNQNGFRIRRPSKATRDALREANVLLIHGFYTYATLFALLYSETLEIFIMPHGSLQDSVLRNSPIKKKVFRIIFLRLLRKRKIHFLVASEDEANQLGLDDIVFDVSVVGIGVPRNKHLLPRKKPISNTPIVLLCMSRIHEIKRIDLCIKALAILVQKEFNFELRIYGDGDHNLKKKLRQLCSSLGVDSLVKFMGEVNNRGKEEAFADAHILLLPSEGENFAIAVAEAINSLTPVVVSKFVAMHRFVDTHKVGFTIEQLSAEQLADAIRRVVHDYDSYVKSCESCASLLAWENVIDNWMRSLNE